MPHSPSVSMMSDLQPVPQRIISLPPRKQRPPTRPQIRPFVDEPAVPSTSLPPKPLLRPHKTQNGRLRIPYSRSRTEDLNDRRSMSHESSYSTRSPSPAYSQSTNRSGSSLSNYDSMSDTSRARSTPRRQFPQTYTDHTLDVHEFYQMEQSPVVFDANLSFVLGVKQPMRQSLRASPAHSERSTASNFLSDQINKFLKRTDHVMEEWSAMGRKKSDTVSYIERMREENGEGGSGIGRSKSATNILVRGFQLIKNQPSLRRSCSRDIPDIPNNNTNQTDDDDRTTVCDEEVKSVVLGHSH
jgi:hypothetical protein